MARPKKETFHEAREEVAQRALEPKTDAKQAKLEKMIEDTKKQMAGKQYCLFVRVDHRGEPSTFTMSAHNTSLSAALVRKYEMKGFKLVHSTIKPIQSDDRVMKLWQQTNYVSIKRDRYDNAPTVSVDEMNRAQLAKEIAKQEALAANTDLEMREQ